MLCYCNYINIASAACRVFIHKNNLGRSRHSASQLTLPVIITRSVFASIFNCAVEIKHDILRKYIYVRLALNDEIRIFYDHYGLFLILKYLSAHYIIIYSRIIFAVTVFS